MSVFALGDQRGKTDKHERGVIEAVVGGHLERFFRRWRRRNGARAHGAVIRHDAEDPLGLLLVTEGRSCSPGGRWCLDFFRFVPREPAAREHREGNAFGRRAASGASRCLLRKCAVMRAPAGEQDAEGPEYKSIKKTHVIHQPTVLPPGECRRERPKGEFPGGTQGALRDWPRA